MRAYGRFMKNTAALLLLLALLSLLLPFCRFQAGGQDMTLSGVEVLTAGGKAGYTYLQQGGVPDDFVLKAPFTWGDVKEGIHYADQTGNSNLLVAAGVAVGLPVILCFLSMCMLFLAEGKKTMVLPTIFTAAVTAELLVVLVGLTALHPFLLAGVYLFAMFHIMALILILFGWTLGGYREPKQKRGQDGHDREENEDRDRRKNRDRGRSRHKKSKRKKAIRLPHWKFMSRFRVRIMFQNISNYLILFVGICFIMVMLAMAVGMPDTLTYYQKHASNLMFTKYQYVLKTYQNADGSIVTTDNEDAEMFAMKSLVKRSDALDEELSTYGVVDDSRYIEISDLESLEKNEVYISDSYADKYGIVIGDTIKLEEKYTDDSYNFKVCGIYDQCQSIAVFMPIDQYRKVFDLDDEAFSGFFSDAKITDIDSDMIASTITKRDITKMCDQLDHSMGSYMQYFQVLCILLSMAMIYLLTKLIIEKNENAISMTKILGYENREIASLYLLSTTIVMIVIDVLTVAVGVWVMNFAWKEILMTYSGWFSFHMETISYVKMFAFVLIGYVIVMILDFQRIKKIPMDQALKNVE